MMLNFFSNRIVSQLNLMAIVVLLLMNACSKTHERDQLKIEEQKELILSLHDDLMLELPKIKRINKKLEKLLVDSTAISSPNKLATIALNNLAKADKNMWDWMHQFNLAHESKSDSLTILYFDEQYNQLRHVQSKMDSAIYVGEDLISNYERAQ